MTNYEYLQQICARFPELDLKVKTEIYANQACVKVIDENDNIVVEKIVDVETDFENMDEALPILDQSCYDIICSMFLMATSQIRKRMEGNVKEKTAKLN